MRNFVSKGWGWEDWIVNEDYCGKILFVKKGRRCSLHYHKLKDETFYIQSGKINMEYLAKEEVERLKEWNWPLTPRSVILNVGDEFDIPNGMVHRFTAVEDSYIIEFSTHHEDSDSYRIEKGD